MYFYFFFLVEQFFGFDLSFCLIVYRIHQKSVLIATTKFNKTFVFFKKKMRRISLFPSRISASSLALTAAMNNSNFRFCATTKNASEQQQETTSRKPGETSEETKTSSSSSLAADDPSKQRKTRNISVFSNTAKGMYVHVPNLLGGLSFTVKDLPFYFWGVMILFVGSQVYVRWKVAKRQTAESAKLGESLLDNRTRDLLGDVENLRNKDPLRLESEANQFHEIFWKRRAKAVSDVRQEKRTIEIARGEMQGVARGTDMSEWLGAKKKDEEEREVARRTHDYIQGFHQHLKAKRLI